MPDPRCGPASRPCLGVDRPLAVRRAPARDRAGAAGRLLGVADAAAVPDQVVAQHHPVALLEERADGVLDLDRVGLVGPAEAAGQPADVGVDGDARDAEAVAEDDVGGLAADPGQGHQVVEPRRHLAVVPLDEGGAQLEQRVGLGPEEAERADDLLEVLARGGRHRRRVGVGREQGRADGVDPAVGGLGAEDGDDEQLERVVEVELDPGVGVGLGQHPVDPAGPSDQARAGLGGGHGWHADSLRSPSPSSVLDRGVRVTWPTLDRIRQGQPP